MQSSFDLEHLHATATNIRLANGLVVDSAVLEASDVGFDEDGARYEGFARAVARLSPQSVEKFLAAQVPPMVQNVSVAFVGDQIVVRATATLMLTVDVTIKIGLEIQDDTRLAAVVHSVEPGIARKLIEDELVKVNPLLDASDLPIPVEFESIDITERAVTLTAVASTD
ncbi:MAG: hypothetical protein AB7F50_00255 [Fimbriimonadaceae bacterium]